MPHIKQQQREIYRELRTLMDTTFIQNKGDLEYLLYCLLGTYMKDRKPFSYTELHSAVYAARHAGHEFERNYLDKREDRAMNENGEAYYDDGKET